MSDLDLCAKLTIREPSLKPQLTMVSFHSTPMQTSRRGTVIRSDAEHLARDSRAMRHIERDFGVNPLSGELLTQPLEMQNRGSDMRRLEEVLDATEKNREEMREIAKVLKQIPFLQTMVINNESLTQNDFIELAKLCRYKRVKRGSKVVSVGEKSDCMHILCKGKVALTYPTSDAANNRPLKFQTIKTKTAFESKRTMTSAKSIDAPVMVDGVPCQFFITQETTNEQGETVTVKKPHPVYSEVSDIKRVLESFKQNDLLEQLRREREEGPLSKALERDEQAGQEEIQKRLTTVRQRKTLMFRGMTGASNLNQLTSQKDPLDSAERSNEIMENSDEASESLHETSDEFATDGSMQEMYLDFDTTRNGGSAEFVIAKLPETTYFGNYGIEEATTVFRYASAWALRNCHFLTVSQEALKQLKSIVNARISAEKIAFLKQIPLLSHLTFSYLRKLEQFFTPEHKIVHSFLYREGEPATYVYLVKKGVFQIQKRLTRPPPTSEKVQDIYEAPLKAARSANKQFRRNQGTETEYVDLMQVDRGQLIGEEDVARNEIYHTTVRCVSQEATLLKIHRDEFKKIEKQKEQWEAILQNAESKIEKYATKILNAGSVKEEMLLPANVSVKADKPNMFIAGDDVLKQAEEIHEREEREATRIVTPDLTQFERIVPTQVLSKGSPTEFQSQKSVASMQRRLTIDSQPQRQIRTAGTQKRRNITLVQTPQALAHKISLGTPKSFATIQAFTSLTPARKMADGVGPLMATRDKKRSVASLYGSNPQHVATLKAQLRTAQYSSRINANMLPRTKSNMPVRLRNIV